MELVTAKHTEQNTDLNEKVLDLEYQQRRNNLVFDGIPESENETDYQCYEKILMAISGLKNVNTNDIWIARCHRLGRKKLNQRDRVSPRPIICCFHWYGDVSNILGDRWNLPKGIYVNEDLPEDWNDRRRVLKPIYKLAKRKQNLKEKTHWSKDKLVIEGKEYSVAPTNNISELKDLYNFDLAGTCEIRDANMLLFQGIHSIYSNFHPTRFVIDGVSYVSMEQYLQSSKASMANDDFNHRRILLTKSLYKAKRYGHLVKGLDTNKWNSKVSDIAYRGLKAKFTQNPSLLQLLLSTGNCLIAESTMDRFWGTGIRLNDNNALFRQNWYGNGLMSELYTRLRDELRSATNKATRATPRD